MKLLRRSWKRLVAALSRRRNEGELADEIASHIEMQAEENLRAGMAPADALRAARLKFGSVESAKESYRDQRGLPWIDALQADFRYALRGWKKSPGFTITAVAAMALGIGTTTSIFCVVNAVLLKPLGVPDPDRLVVLTTTAISDTGESSNSPIASPASFEHWRTQTAVLHDVSALRPGVMNYAGGDRAEQWHSMEASADAFRCLGMPLLLGRGFTREEDLPSGPRVAVLSESVWKQRFAGDPRILGNTISLSGQPYTVVGIAPKGPAFVENAFSPADVYVPFRIDPNTDDQGQTFFALAHINPGVTLEQTKERLRSSAAQFRTRFPDALGPKDFFSATPLRELLVSGLGTLLFVLAGAVSLVLLIACANVANLLLARAVSRSREMAIRTAIGASRARVIRQLLTESVLLSLAGGFFGLCLGQTGIHALLAANQTLLPTRVAIDWRVLGFAFAVSLATGIFFGLYPALQASRAGLNAGLKDCGGRPSTSPPQNKVRAALVVSEVSLAVVLLVGSGLLIRTFVALYRVDPGFETKNILTMGMALDSPKYRKTQAVEEAIRDGVEQIRSVPGVVSAASTCCEPLQGDLTLNFDVIGRPSADGSDSGQGGWAAASPGFFDVFRIPLRRGRTFTDRDGLKSPPVVVINEAMARQYWKDRDPLNDSIVIGRGLGKQYEADPARQIIGIVGDVRDQFLYNLPRPIMYLPQAQLPDVENAAFFHGVVWVVRTQGEPHALAAAIQDRLKHLTGLPVYDVRSIDEVVTASTGQQRFTMLLMTVFGCCATLLAAVGIYGLMAYIVEQRRQEIGIRLALGAQSVQVKRMVAWQGIGPALLGVLIGTAAAWGLSRVMESLLFGVRAQDPVVFGIVPAVLAIVALLAIWLPAGRASRVDPSTALRYE